MSKEGKDKVTFWTILDKLKYFVLLALFIVIIIILSKGYSIETSFFKIGKVPDTLFIEKEVKIPSDTVYKERVITKYVEVPQKKSTVVKIPKTDVTVNEKPANINTGTNNGILGNNNTVNNFKEPDIILSQKDKNDLIKLIESEFEKITNKETKRVSVSTIPGSNKAMKICLQINSFLEKSGYKIGSVGIEISSVTKQGVHISAREDRVNVFVNII